MKSKEILQEPNRLEAALLEHIDTARAGLARLEQTSKVAAITVAEITALLKKYGRK